MAIELGLPGSVKISSALTEYVTALRLAAEDAARAKTGSPINIRGVLSSVPEDVATIIANEIAEDALMARWVDVPQGHDERIARKWTQRCAFDTRRTHECDIWFATPESFSSTTASAQFAAPRRLLVLLRARDTETALSAASRFVTDVAMLSIAQFDSDGFIISRGA